MYRNGEFKSDTLWRWKNKKANEFIDAFKLDDAIEYLGSFDEPWVPLAIEYAKEHFKELLCKK